jgi:hypothetical protein
LGHSLAIHNTVPYRWHHERGMFFIFAFFMLSNWSLQSCLIAATLYRLGRGEGQEPCVLRNTTQPSRTAQLTRKPAAPMCQRKHHTPGDRVSVHCARPATGVASVRWDKTSLPAKPSAKSDDAGPIGLPVGAGCNRAWTRTQNL